MKGVTQTKGYVDDEHRGNCFPACVASIFELALTAVPQSENALPKWLRKWYPAISLVRRTYFKPHPEWPWEYEDEFRDEAPYWPGFWIATVESPRFTTLCHRCQGEKRITVYLERDSDLPDRQRKKGRFKCHICDGKGRTTGLHAVVMQHAVLAFDPSPFRGEGIGRFHGESVFFASDPAKLIRHEPVSLRT